VDARAATTDFGLYHAIFDSVVDESVPTRGVRTDALLTQLRGALAALFAAADRAADRGRSRIDERDVARARDSIPRPSVPLAQVLTLAPNRQQVLRALLYVEAENCSSVEETAAAIAADVDPVRTAEFLLTIVDGMIVEATTRTDDPRERVHRDPRRRAARRVRELATATGPADDRWDAEQCRPAADDRESRRSPLFAVETAQ